MRQPSQHSATKFRHSESLGEIVRAAAEPLTGGVSDYDSLLALVGDARVVLLGEASHGTHEFYRERAQITKRLITERGFNAIAVEADWPDAYRINSFVQGVGSDADAVASLSGFKRFPQWMWRNADVLDFISWLREYNDGQAERNKCGYYGLDLYSLHGSIEAVLDYLKRVDPEAAQRALKHYGCFEQFGASTEAYGYATAFGMRSDCEREVVNELVALRRKAMDYLHRDGQVAADAYFCAEQNALVVRNAEEYYRNMFQRGAASWNLRDSHMMESLRALEKHLSSTRGRAAKIVVWAHNSHLGDARATEMGERGEWNLGQLARDHFKRDVVLIGFTTHTGTVTAASDWDAPAERKQIRPSMRDSYERVFHEADCPRFFLNLRDGGDTSAALRAERLERAIGVIYRPESERASHYFNARLPDQFDAVLHFDYTSAVEPLERTAEWGSEVEETFPSGL
ncbi:MAG: erythromycin esterase family protein [Chthoniobacterales bacterium]